MIVRPSFLLVLTPMLLSACATNGGYPSLAKRPFESSAQPVPASLPSTPNAPPADGDLRTRIEALGVQARTGTEAFDNLYGQAAERVRAGAGASVGSENWVVAEVAVARLEQERTPVMVALASLDSLYADRMNAVANGDAAPAVLVEIEAARQPLLATVETQNSRIEALRAMLASP